MRQALEKEVKFLVQKHVGEDAKMIIWARGGLRGEVAIVTLAGDEEPTIAVKLGSPDWIRDQLPHYRELFDVRLPLPRIVAATDTAIIMDYAPGVPLHEIIARGSHWEKFLPSFVAALSALMKLWSTGRATPCPARAGLLNPPWKILREHFPEAVRGKPIVVNGETLLTIEEATAILEEGFAQMAPYTCLTHGDPRPDNILLTEHGAYCFIDTRVGYKDWAHDLACLTRQRFYANAKFWSPITWDPERGAIAFHVTFPSLADGVEDLAWKFGRAFAASSIGDKGAERRTLLYMGGSWISEVVQNRHRADRGILQLVPHWEFFCLAQALLLLMRAKELP